MIFPRHRRAMLLTLLIVGLFAGPSIVGAEVTYPTDSGIFLTDAVGVLNSSESAELNDVSNVLEAETGTVLVVVIINSTSDYTSGRNANLSLGTYTGMMFDEWAIGDQDYRDGLLIILAVNQSGNGYDWAYTGGDHWQENWGVLTSWEDNLDDSVFEQLNESNWMDSLNTMMRQLSDEVVAFWMENPFGPEWEESGEWSTKPVLEGADDEEDVYASSLGESLISLVSCFGCLGVLGLLFFALNRGSSRRSSRGGAQYYPNYNGGGYHPHNEYRPHGGYQQNNYYMGGESPQNNNAPTPQNRQGSSRTSRDGNSSRSSSSSRGGGSSRSSSSRGSSSSRSSGSSRGGGSSGGGRNSGGGRR